MDHHLGRVRAERDRPLPDGLRHREDERRAGERGAKVATVATPAQAGPVGLAGHVDAVHGDDQRDAEAPRGPGDQPAVATEVGVHHRRAQLAQQGAQPLRSTGQPQQQPAQPAARGGRVGDDVVGAGQR